MLCSVEFLVSWSLLVVSWVCFCSSCKLVDTFRVLIRPLLDCWQEFFLGSGVYTSVRRRVMSGCLIFVTLVAIIHQGFIIHITVVTCQVFHSFFIYQFEYLCNEKLHFLFLSPTFPRRQPIAVLVQTERLRATAALWAQPQARVGTRLVLTAVISSQ